MSDESKITKTFEFPMMPMFGVDFGRELGSIDARLNQLENDNREIKRDVKALDAKIDAIDAKFEAKTDKMANALHRLDERTKSLDSKFNLSIGLTGAVLAAVIAGFILQYLK